MFDPQTPGGIVRCGQGLRMWSQRTRGKVRWAACWAVSKAPFGALSQWKMTDLHVVAYMGKKLVRDKGCVACRTWKDLVGIVPECHGWCNVIDVWLLEFLSPKRTRWCPEPWHRRLGLGSHEGRQHSRVGVGGLWGWAHLSIPLPQRDTSH